MTYKLGIDVGGTFTDFCILRDNGTIFTHKTPSNTEKPYASVIDGLMEIAALENYEETLRFVQDIDLIVHGTTITTNAVLTRNGSKTALVTTSGFRDILQMRRGIREELYNNHFQAPEPIVPRYLRLEVNERIDAEGNILKHLNEKDTLQSVEIISQEGVEAIGICLMNSYKNNVHEVEIKKYLQQKYPNINITLSSEILPKRGLYDRVATTVLNAYASKILDDYLLMLTESLEKNGFQGILLIMQSNGGISSVNEVRKKAVNTLLSGPAAAPVAAINYCEKLGVNNCILSDMGGTSFDVSTISDGVISTCQGGEINGLRQAMPMVDIRTIGAGGGSIGWIDSDGLLKMGPKSAGAQPGPVCYNKGGFEPTCTDANLILGYIDPKYFLGGKMTINYEKAVRCINEQIAVPLGLSVVDASVGMYQVMNTNLAGAIREICMEQGIDPREQLLIVTGGAGPIHAGMIALELDIPYVLIPEDSSVFCASGMLMSNLMHEYVRTNISKIEYLQAGEVHEIYIEMKEEGKQTLLNEGINKENMEFRFSIDARYVGQHHSVNIEISLENDVDDNFKGIITKFHQFHKRTYGYWLEDEKVEVLNFWVKAIGKRQQINNLKREGELHSEINVANLMKGKRKAFNFSKGDYDLIPVYEGKLPVDQIIDGPAIIERVNTTIFIPMEFNVVGIEEGLIMYVKKEKELINNLMSKKLLNFSN